MSRKRSKTKRVKEAKRIEAAAKLTRKEKRNINQRRFWINDPKMIEFHNEELECPDVEKTLRDISEIVIPIMPWQPIVSEELFPNPEIKEPFDKGPVNLFNSYCMD